MIKLLVDLKMENQERTNATCGKDVFLQNVWFKVFSIHYIVTHEMVNRFVFSSEYYFHFWYYSPYCSSLKLGFAIDLWSLFIIVNALYHVNFIKLYKANVWTFDSCHNSVSGLSEKKKIFWNFAVDVVHFLLFTQSLGKWLETNINQNVKAPSIHHTVWCYDQHEWGLLFCVVLQTFDTVTDYDTKTILFFVVFQRTLDQRHCSLMDCQRM